MAKKKARDPKKKLSIPAHNPPMPDSSKPAASPPKRRVQQVQETSVSKPSVSSAAVSPSTFNYLTIAGLAAVCFLVFYPPFNRGLFFKEDMFVYHIFTGAVAALITLIKAKNKDYTLIKTPLDWAILAYASAYLLSYVGAIHPGEAFYGFLKALNYFMLYWLVLQTVKNYTHYEIVLKTMLAAGTGVALIGLLAAVGYSNYPGAFTDGLIMSTLQYHNTTAAYLAVISLIGITLWSKEKGFLRQFIYAAATYFMLLVTFATASKGAYLILIVGIILLPLGMPGLYRLKSIYILLLTLIIAFVASTRLLPAITGPDPASGGAIICLGLAAILGGQIIYILLLKLIQIVKLPQIRPLYYYLTAAVLLIALAGTVATQVSIPDNMQRIGGILDTQDMSYVTRMDFIRWSWDIIKDHPIIGTGAGGWQALYHQYQDYLFFTTETHNHFMQVWVETGTIGLLTYISIWLLLLYQAFRLWQRFRSNKDQEHWALIYGPLVAAIALGLHACIDFDLSLAAPALLLWSLMALTSAAYSSEFVDSLSSPIWINRPISLYVFGTAMVMFFLGCGFAFNAASQNAQQGAIEINKLDTADSDELRNEYFQSAVNLYEKAVALDPNNAEYAADLASIYALQYTSLVQSGQTEGLSYVTEKINQNLAQAEKLKPNDVKIRNSMLKTASMLSDFYLLKEFTEKAITTNPNDMQAYKTLSDLLTNGARQYLEADNIETAQQVAQEAIDSYHKLQSQMAKVDLDNPYWLVTKLEITPQLSYNIGQAYCITGDYSTAIQLLGPLLDNPDVANDDIKLWYALALEKAGDIAAAQAVLDTVAADRSQFEQMTRNL